MGKSPMERRRPENISLPPMRDLLEHHGSNSERERYESQGTWYNIPPRTAPLSASFHNYQPISSYSSDRAPRICGQHRPLTPPSSQRVGGRVPHVYPSPASDHHLEDTEMTEGGGSGYLPHSATTPLFPHHNSNDNDHPVPQRRLSSIAMQRDPPAATTPQEPVLTPSIVHYRPEGIPSTRSRRSSIQKSGSTKKSTELKIRMVKWDRISDKGTAPLKTEPKSGGPRACTLCHLTRRKCERTDGTRPNESHPCSACQSHSFVCQFIPPSQLRDSTAQPPSIESLKLLTDQAQRLRTIELEEKVVKLEYELRLARAELRVKDGYIDNLRVYEGVINGYVMRLRGRLEELERGCRLLEYRIPAMPTQKEVVKIKDGSVSEGSSTERSDVATSTERSDLEYTPVSEIVDGSPN